MRNATQKYKIALSMDFSDAAFGGLFTNGLRQNVLFLYHLFQASPNCEKVFLLNCGSIEYEFPDGALRLLPDTIVRFDDVKDDIDFLIAVGSRPGPDQLRYLRARGCRTIFYKGGNSAILSMESVASKDLDTYGELYFDCDLFDTLWMTPQHMHTYSRWAECLYRVNVHEVPQIWSPALLDLQDKSIRAKFGYRARVSGSKWKVGITDPNITIMKTAHMPVLVCEAAYRTKSELFEKVYVTNSMQLMDNNHFTSFLKAMSVTGDGILTVEPRFMLYDFLANHVDAIVTHHWENGLNYLYYEVLFGNYPLVHNSSFISEFGYHYDDFDAEGGGLALLDAMENHDERLDEYGKRNAALFRRLDPRSSGNIKLHEDLLFAL